MTLSEYARFDALALAELVAKKRVSAQELAETAAKAIEAINPSVNAVVETYADRIDDLDERTLGAGPFRGVPFLMKDVFGHEAGRRIERGSRLCRGMIAQADSHLCERFRASGLNILGRSAAPEYSMSGTTESLMCGNTSTPWKHGYSAGGSTAFNRSAHRNSAWIPPRDRTRDPAACDAARRGNALEGPSTSAARVCK